MRFADDLLPRAARNSPARSLKTLLSTTVALESGIGVVVATTICFDYQTGITPEKIRRQPKPPNVERDVDFRARQVGSTTHGEKQPLQLTASSPGIGIEFVEDPAKPGYPPAPSVPLDQLLQLGELEQPENLSLGNRPAQLP